MSDNRGGKRVGAGRPKGGKNRKTEAQEKAVKATGLTPLEYLTSVYRDEANELKDRVDAAKAAAPYVHPKLATVDLTSSDRTMSPPKIEIINADQAH